MDEAYESRLNAKYVEGRTAYALEYQEENDQLLDDQLHHVPLQNKLNNIRVEPGQTFSAVQRRVMPRDGEHE